MRIPILAYVKIRNQSISHFKIVNDDVYPYQLLIFIKSINTNFSCVAKNIQYRYFSRIHNIYISHMDLCIYFDQVHLITLVTQHSKVKNNNQGTT